MEHQIQFVQLDKEELKRLLINTLKDSVKEIEERVQPKALPKYITRNQLAEWLNVDLSTIHNWKKKGKIVGYAIGNRVYYKPEEVVAAMKPLTGKS